MLYLGGCELDEAAGMKLENGAVADRGDAGTEVGHDDRKEAVVEARGVKVVPDRVTSDAAVGVDLSNELLVAGSKCAQQPTRFEFGDDDAVALRLVL